MFRGIRIWLKRIADTLLSLMLLAVGVVGAGMRNSESPDEADSLLLEWFYGAVQDYGAISLIILGGLSGALRIVLWKIGQPWARDSVAAVLDEVCAHAFIKNDDDHAHHH